VEQQWEYSITATLQTGGTTEGILHCCDATVIILQSGEVSEIVTHCVGTIRVNRKTAKETARKQAAEGRGSSTAHRTGLYLVWCENKHVTMYYGAEVQTVVK
jgi:hypothetical protein